MDRIINIINRINYKPGSSSDVIFRSKRMISSWVISALIFGGLFLFISGCSDNWNSHYKSELISEDVSDMTLYEFFQGESSYRDFFTMLQEAGIDEELSRDQYLTVWAIKNDNFNIEDMGGIEPDHVAKYHMNYLAFGTTNLKDGLRIQALNGIYLTISQDDNTSYVNDAPIVSSMRFSNGVVHEIEEMLIPMVNMFEYITLLEDDHSIIKDSIITYNRQVFDRMRSVPIGVDETGNTIYDSVFYTSNPLFENADFSSEFSQFTLFLPSNEVMNACFAKLGEQYALMGQQFSLEDSILALDWIKKAIFHEGVINDYTAVLDLNSPFGKVWRTTVQKVDELSFRPVSNGVVYDITEMKVPNNVIISRIKSLVYYYTHLTEQQQEELYTLKGVTSHRVFQADVSPIEGFYYWMFEVSGDPESEEEFSVEFLPLDYNADSDIVSIMQIPPGEYNLYMGFRSLQHPYLDIYFHQGSDPIPEDIEPIGLNIPASQSNPWNYDRYNDTDPNIARWNGLGGLVGVVNIEGEEMSTFRIKVKFNSLQAVGSPKRFQIYHWALRPTANNY